MSRGRRARDLADDEREQQATHAHATRNWVFLHGTSDQFRTVDEATRLYRGPDAVLRADPEERVLTDAGRAAAG